MDSAGPTPAGVCPSRFRGGVHLQDRLGKGDGRWCARRASADLSIFPAGRWRAARLVRLTPPRGGEPSSSSPRDTPRGHALPFPGLGCSSRLLPPLSTGRVAPIIPRGHRPRRLRGYAQHLPWAGLLLVFLGNKERGPVPDTRRGGPTTHPASGRSHGIQRTWRIRADVLAEAEEPFLTSGDVLTESPLPDY